MKFYFCEKCGKRLTEKDIDAGSARDKKLRGVFCSDCAAGVLTMESLPLTEEQAQQLIAQDAPKQDGGKRASGAHPVRRTGAHAPVRGSARGATTTAQGPIRATGATTARGAARGPAPQSSPTMLYVGGGGGALALLVVGVLLFSGGKPAPSPKKADPVSLTVAPAPAPAPAVKTAPLAASAGKTAEGPTAPLELKPQELSPKELYELRVKEGLIKPATPAPAEEPPIATTGEGWEEPFAAGSLDAWTQRLGSWAFEGGVLYSDSAQSQNKQGHLLSKVDYRDFELTASFRVTGGNVDHFHFQWHGNDKSVAPGGTISEWHAFRVLVRGHEFSATVGGKPVRVLGQHNLLAQGTFGFYCFGGAKLELKDVRLRRLAPPASPSAALSADWKPLFDGTSLNGWEQLKGSFGVADGTIASASIDENTKAVMLATVDAYADFEAAGSFMVTGHPYVEIHLMGGPDLGEHNFTFDTEVGSWHAFLVRMEGDRPTLALDGKDVPLRVRSPKPLNGVRLGIWKGIQGQLLLKDVRIRSILPPVQVVQAVPPAPGGNEPWSEPFAAGLDAWEQRKGAWTIQDGILSGDSRTSDTGQNLLASKETYADFELTTLFRTSGGHRHVYVHYHDFDKNIQATGVGPEWHALRLLVRGNAFAASVDGAPAHVVDAGGAKADGSIGFFINESGMVEFKDFKLRRLEPVKPAGGEGGWISLFDGKSHDAWTVAKGSAAVEDGLLVLTDTQAAGGARLDGKQAFENFEFEMEFQHTKENYLELYLQSAVAGAKSHGWQFNASLHGWHKARIVFAGDRPALSLDGKEIPLSNAGTAASVRLSFWKGHQGQLKMRNLRVRPLAVATEPAPAPAPAPEPKEAAPNDAEWTDLLEGGLAGWTTLKGKWIVTENKVLWKVREQGVARIETKESYGDFELTCEIRLPDAQSRLGEIQFRDYGWVYAIEPESRAWLTLHAAAKGNQITCTLDGKALQPTTDSKRTNLNGKLAFYSNRDWGLSVRNLKIKTLKP